LKNYHHFKTSAKVLVFGSAAVDINAKVTKLLGEVDTAYSSSTSPGLISLSMGGVGRNVAEACHRCVTSHSPNLSSATMLVSMIGEDHFGQLITEDLQRLGMRTDGLFKNVQHPSAACNMVMDSAGDLIGGVADMSIIQSLDSNMVSFIEFLHH
jgi:pseudouridine-5'-phosphate glycosidase/pseudouridine kinase